MFKATSLKYYLFIFRKINPLEALSATNFSFKNIFLTVVSQNSYYLPGEHYWKFLTVIIFSHSSLYKFISKNIGQAS